MLACDLESVYGYGELDAAFGVWAGSEDFLFCMVECEECFGFFLEPVYFFRVYACAGVG